MIYETDLVNLPSKPDWFDSALSDIARVDGKPLFKLVDGTKELVWRNGGITLKHLFKHRDYSPFIKKNNTVRAVGICDWVVEVYISPREIDYDQWCANRFKQYKVNGVESFIDVLGPYPSEGMYVYCFEISEGENYVCYPGQAVIDKCKMLYKKAVNDTETLDMALKRIEKEAEKLDNLVVKKVSDNIYQSLGLAARRLHNAEISKPIRRQDN